MTTLVFVEHLWKDITQILDDSVESAGVLIARTSRSSSLNLLARSIEWVPDDAYLRRERSALEITSQGYFPALKRAADDGSVALFFHSHPGGHPDPSRYDDEVDASLAQPFSLRTGQNMYGSLILGGTPSEPRFSGRISAKGAFSPLDRIRVIGHRLNLLTRISQTADATTFDRQIRVFGFAGQGLLSQLRVGIVGAGGTGSAVFEQLVRLGVGEILICDDDDVTRTNLTRIHESGMRDAGKAKVKTLKAAAKRIGLGTKVTALDSRITDRKTALRFRECDVVFGCTDDNRGRAILSRLAYWYLIPVIDTAFMVDVEDHKVRGLFGRISTIQPGNGCLFCRGRIDLDQLRSEGLAADERLRLAAEGYVPGLGEPDPSVGTYTSLVASFAVHELLDRLFGFSEQPPSELLVRLHDRALNRLAAPGRDGHYCADESTWGRGDTEPFLEQLWPE